MPQLYDKNQLIENPASFQQWQITAFHEFAEKLTNKDHPFPCIPAVIGCRLGHLRYAFCEDPRKSKSREMLASALKTFREHSRIYGNYTSLIVFFENHEDLLETYTIREYETLFWSLLMDVCKYDLKNWPEHIPEDPMHHVWEYCFEEEQYFVYCATPCHIKRKSRHSPFMTLAITPRWVLNIFNSESLAADKIKMKIRERLAEYDSIPAHPDLNLYGSDDNFEWKQYFLRDDQSSAPICPFAHLHKAKN
ncbi:YqcI/YcgG family protein [Metabacillus sp. RGM 3146]|uniref:YqcI/YcgG family protein n=1 Tax=Metabacillus sp. RGM 3146 TaxID=3401092 RepID=UPI003B9DADEA